ncbi:MAG: endo-1,4-beta-xylanase [Leptolyngbya sp. SIO4C1]|nr:endo-1,4-beta-xylanase [Leptolyngbya sp. SIO4C1]
MRCLLKRQTLLAVLLGLALFLLPSLYPTDASIMTLSALAALNGIRMGTAVSFPALQQDERYRDVLAREFRQLTPENEMKFSRLHPEPERYDFDKADTLVNFADTHGIMVRGHTLVWHSQIPDWVKAARSRDAAIALLRNHIQTVVGHYRGQVMAWDVVNEAIADSGRLRDTVWLRQIGPDYIGMAFRWAHAADPNARLFYNDYGGEGLGRKSEAIYRLVSSLVEKDIPIDGVGLQMHLSLQNAPDASDVATNLQRLGELGLETHITEMDVRLALPASEQDRLAQADLFRTMLSTCIAADSCSNFTTWGFTDRYSWIPHRYKDFGAALLFDRDYQPKMAYAAMLEALDPET